MRTLTPGLPYKLFEYDAELASPSGQCSGCGHAASELYVVDIDEREADIQNEDGKSRCAVCIIPELLYENGITITKVK